MLGRILMFASLGLLCACSIQSNASRNTKDTSGIVWDDDTDWYGNERWRAEPGTCDSYDQLCWAILKNDVSVNQGTDAALRDLLKVHAPAYAGDDRKDIQLGGEGNNWERIKAGIANSPVLFVNELFWYVHETTNWTPRAIRGVFAAQSGITQQQWAKELQAFLEGWDVLEDPIYQDEKLVNHTNPDLQGDYRRRSIGIFKIVPNERNRFRPRVTFDNSAINPATGKIAYSRPGATADILYGQSKREFQPMAPNFRSNKYLEGVIALTWSHLPKPSYLVRDGKHYRITEWTAAVHQIRLTAKPDGNPVPAAPEGLHVDDLTATGILYARAQNVLGVPDINQAGGTGRFYFRPPGSSNFRWTNDNLPRDEDTPPYAEVLSTSPLDTVPAINDVPHWIRAILAGNEKTAQGKRKDAKRDTLIYSYHPTGFALDPSGCFF